MYGHSSYVKHLSDVYVALYDYGVRDINILAASWLHDIIEMTKINYSILKNEFNKDIAELVYCVTDELGRNRKERHEKTFPKLQQNSDAIILKQADLVSNVQFSFISEDPRFNMYKKEYPKFRDALKPHGGLEGLWNILDEILIG
jgi:(p)ppGpp synthase/HD superfamily hydrolase